MIGCTVEPENGAVELFGAVVNTLQSGIEISEDSIRGTLHGVTDYTGFSGDAALQSGNFLALKFEATEGAVVRAGLNPSAGSGLVTLDEDMNGVWRISNKDEQNFEVEVTKDGKTVKKIYSLSGLVCETPEA